MAAPLRIILFSLLLSACAHSPRQPSSAFSAAHEKLLSDSLLFYHEALRHAPSGQYFDARPLAKGAAPDYNSSVAATGMGLVNLALLDQMGLHPGAYADALRTLRFATGRGTLGKRPYVSLRSRAGWFRHWFDARTGANNGASLGDGFSTIDTAILVAGAQIAAGHFAAKGNDANGELARLASELLHGVRWETAISDADAGKLYLNYDLASQEPKASTAVFNEYILVACLGAAAEKAKGTRAGMTAFWEKHYARPDGLPRKTYDGLELLTDHPGHFLSSFTIQFATYLCGDVARSDDYLVEMARAQQADRRWSQRAFGQGHYWGLGAGEVRHRDAEGKVVGSYHADAIDDNPHLMASPHIIAGFLPVYPDGLTDLLAIQAGGKCAAEFGGRRTLWRCSVKDLLLPVDRLQAIDYSSMFLGLAAHHPAVGLDFFRRHGAGPGKP